MKVIFLDIDGVLNSEEYALSLGMGGMLGIDPDKVRILDRILEATGAKLVISSSWRGSPDLLADIRRDVGEYIDITPRLSGIRGSEVREWLRSHHLQVSRYAILDDDSDFYKYQPLFKTTWKKGLTDEIADNVIKYLTK